MNELSQFSAVSLLEVLLVATALLITTSQTVQGAVSLYQWQSALVAIVTTTTAIAEGEDTSVLSILFIALLPALLLVSIRPLLHRATLARSVESTSDDLKMLIAPISSLLLAQFDLVQQRFFSTSFTQPAWLLGYRARVETRMDLYRMQERDAELEWQSRQKLEKGLGGLLLFLILLAVAFLIPFAMRLPDPASHDATSERIGLAVALTLHLVGLFNMISKGDIISQVIGLLIMDHGLYLAVVRIIEIPRPAGLFVISLYFYTLITIFILVILLPQVRAKTDSIDLDRIAEKSDLRSQVGSE